MKILVYGINYSPELTGVGKYTGEMTAWLARRGHKCRVIAAPPYYPEWKINGLYSRWKYRTEFMSEVEVTRCPLWVPKQPETINRLVHLVSFSITSFPVFIKRILFWKPDVVLCIAPSLVYMPQILILCKIFRIKRWLHIQDFEIDAMIDINTSKTNQLVSHFAFFIESLLLRNFGKISTISNRMRREAERKLGTHGDVVLFPNWVDVNGIKPVNDAFYRKNWNIEPDDIVAMYSGNIGKKQGLEIVIQCAKRLEDVDNLKFLIVGEGANKDKLVEEIKKCKLNNIEFYPLQPYEKLSELLNAANIHLVTQKSGMADIVFPSKLSSILSVGGHCIITAYPDTELGEFVIDNPGIATLVPPEDIDALEDSIRKLIISNVTLKCNDIARNYAEKHLSKDSILLEFEDQLSRFVNK